MDQPREDRERRNLSCCNTTTRTSHKRPVLPKADGFPRSCIVCDGHTWKPCSNPRPPATGVIATIEQSSTITPDILPRNRHHATLCVEWLHLVRRTIRIVLFERNEPLKRKLIAHPLRIDGPSFLGDHVHERAPQVMNPSIHDGCATWANRHVSYKSGIGQTVAGGGPNSRPLAARALCRRPHAPRGSKCRGTIREEV